MNTAPPLDRLPLKLGVLDVGTFPLCIRLAPRVEAMGYGRYWISEHHHGEGATPNPTLLLPVVAGRTRTLRVGTAGILLRFQSPLAVAESFRLLHGLHRDRIDLGVARSGTLDAAARALYDGRPETYTEAQHEAKVTEVQRLLYGRLPPGHPLAGTTIDPPLAQTGAPPLWVDSTSIDGAGLAAKIGARYAFHDAFGHAVGSAAVARYEAEFRPSPELGTPVWNVTVGGYCAEDEADADSARKYIFGDVHAKQHLIVGTVDRWRDELSEIVRKYRTSEIVVQTLARYDLERQVRSFGRIAEAARALNRDAEVMEPRRASA